MNFIYSTRMLQHCPHCGADVSVVVKHDPSTSATVWFCPRCGEEIRRTALKERDEAEGD